MVELADVLDDNGNPIGSRATKEDIFKNSWWRLVVHVWVVNPDTKELLIQKRAIKGIFDSLWDVSIGGGVQAGEESVMAAQRETKEELGLTFDETEFEYIGRFKVPKLIPEKQLYSKEFSDTFLVKSNFDLNEVNRQETEVAQVGAVSLTTLSGIVTKAESDIQWVPHGIAYYESVAKEILERL